MAPMTVNPGTPRTLLADLIAAEEAGALPALLPFWGHRPQRDASIGPGCDEQAWSEARFELVVAGNLAKFTGDADLRRSLSATGSKVLAEASPRDRIWGIGMSASHEHAARPSRWRGLNLLGFALMNVRDQL